MVPLSVVKKTVMKTDLKELAFFQVKVRTQDLVFFCRQFSVMLGAGIDIGGALGILADQVPNPTLQKKTQEIYQEIQKGSSLSEAMASHKEFPPLLINMIRSGEVSGIMDQVMEKMAQHYEKQVNFKVKLKKALTYPAIVLLTIGFIIPILMIYVVPSFVEIFDDAEIALPLATQIIIGLSEWMQGNLAMILLGLIFLISGLIGFVKSEKGKGFFDQTLLSLPLLGDLNKKTTAALFSETLALLLTAGVPIFQSLEIVKEVLPNTLAKKEMSKTLAGVREGRTISSSLESSKIYPPMMVSMLRIGEETGTLGHMLDKIAHYYNLEVETQVEQITVLIEPILMFIIAFIVGGIMIAVILPTFTLATELM